MIIKIKIADGVDECEAVRFVKQCLRDKYPSGVANGIYIKAYIEIESQQKTFVIEKIKPFMPQVPKKERANS